jgi:hypothetical protein
VQPVSLLSMPSAHCWCALQPWALRRRLAPILHPPLILILLLFGVGMHCSRGPCGEGQPSLSLSLLMAFTLKGATNPSRCDILGFGAAGDFLYES